jgi:hypothetical protein
VLAFIWGLNIGFMVHGALSSLAVETPFIR